MSTIFRVAGWHDCIYLFLPIRCTSSSTLPQPPRNIVASYTLTYQIVTSRPHPVNPPPLLPPACALKALCHSYCCALDSFALDPVTRSSALDSGCIASFPKLCGFSARVFARLAHFIYSVSCSPEHVPSLVLEHDCIKVVAIVVDPDGKSGRKPSDGARETCAALLFNLSTQVVADRLRVYLSSRDSWRGVRAESEGPRSI